MDKSFLYFVIFPNYKYLKIGKSNNIENRMLSIRHLWGDIDYENSYYLELPTSKVFKIEKALHNLLDDFKITNISGDGYTEIFSLDVLDTAISLIEMYAKQQGDLKLVKGIPKTRIAVEKNVKIKEIPLKKKTHRVIETFKEFKEDSLSFIENINYLEKSLRFFFNNHYYLEYQYSVNEAKIDFYVKVYRTDLCKQDKPLRYGRLLKLNSRYHYIKIKNHVVKADPRELFCIFDKLKQSTKFFDSSIGNSIFYFDSSIKREKKDSTEAIFKFSYAIINDLDKNFRDSVFSIDDIEKKSKFMHYQIVSGLTMFYNNILKMPKKSPSLINEDLIQKYNNYQHGF